MASTKTEFQLFLESEVNKVKGIYYPVKAGFLHRLLIKKVSCRKLHPNPNDEFCFPEIGPNYGIISQYEADYRRFGTDFSNLSYTHDGIAERIMIEKTRPEGYMILNGHHRWAAALRTGIPRLPVRIVDLTQESDIRKMLDTAGFDKRVTLDLDGVVFRPDSETALEKPLPFPKLKKLGEETISSGVCMGEGWLLTAEMLELCESGYENIVCTQPFGCLPNHINGKGMIGRIRKVFPNSNITPIDYDPSATKVNQENRIKLMLAVARENLNERVAEEKAEKIEDKAGNSPE